MSEGGRTEQRRKVGRERKEDKEGEGRRGRGRKEGRKETE